MKVAFVLGPFCSEGRPLDYNTLLTNDRGCSGSDWGVSRVAQEFAKLGHSVSLFTTHAANKPDKWENVSLFHLRDLETEITSEHDAIISWSEPDVFRDLPINPIRLCSQQLNGFTYCKPGFDDYVDIWASPSDAHLKFHVPQMPCPEKWVMIPDGCDPELYSPGEKIPGRVVHISSPDRGAHWLLQEWQNIKKKVPEASLLIFYHSSQGDVCSFERGFPTFQPGTGKLYNANKVSPSIYELGQRMRYFNQAMKKLVHLDVKHVGSVSRDQITKELNQAMVLGYPASVVSDFCEGFGCAVMEACAAGCIPVISDVDAFGDIYGGVAPMIKSPVEPNMKLFTELVVRSLKDEKFIKETTEKCRELANKYTWKLAADKYIDAIENHPKYKGNK